MQINRIIKYLDDLNKPEIVNVGCSLDLDYSKLRGLTAEQIPHEMIRWWLGKRDNVMEISVVPMPLHRAGEGLGIVGNIYRPDVHIYHIQWNPEMQTFLGPTQGVPISQVSRSQGFLVQQ